MARTKPSNTSIGLMRPLIAETLNQARSASTPAERTRHFTVAIAMLRAADDPGRATDVSVERDLDDAAEYAARTADTVDLDDLEAVAEFEANLRAALTGPTFMASNGEGLSFTGVVSEGQPHRSLHRACDALDVYTERLLARVDNGDRNAMTRAANIALVAAEALLAHPTEVGAALSEKYLQDVAAAYGIQGYARSHDYAAGMARAAGIVAKAAPTHYLER